MQPICKVFWIGVGFGEELAVIAKCLERDKSRMHLDVIGIDLKENVIEEAKNIIPSTNPNMQCVVMQGDAMTFKYSFFEKEDIDVIYTSAEISEIFCLTYFYFALTSPTIKYIVCPLSFASYIKGKNLNLGKLVNVKKILSAKLATSEESRQICLIDISDKNDPNRAVVLKRTKWRISEYYNIKEMQCFVGFISHKSQFQYFEAVIRQLIAGEHEGQNVRVVLPTPSYLANIGGAYNGAMTTTDMVERVGQPYAENCTSEKIIRDYWHKVMAFFKTLYRPILIQVLHDILNFTLSDENESDEEDDEDEDQIEKVYDGDELDEMQPSQSDGSEIGLSQLEGDAMQSSQPEADAVQVQPEPRDDNDVHVSDDES